jgi:hypothetical protein
LLVGLWQPQPLSILLLLVAAAAGLPELAALAGTEPQAGWQFLKGHHTRLQLAAAVPVSTIIPAQLAESEAILFFRQ